MAGERGFLGKGISEKNCSTNFTNKNVTLHNNCLPVAKRGEKIPVLHLFNEIAIAYLGSVPFFGQGFNFFQIGKGTTQNENIQRLFPLILYPLTSVGIKSKPTKKTPPPMK